MNLDLQLIIELQKIASASASDLLDYKDVSHTLSGVALQTPGREFMVEEACSGIHSLYSCLAAMAFWGVVFRYGLVRMLLTLIQTIGWVLVANSIRVFSIVYCRTRWDIDLENGLPHELLGIATYAMALILSLSTDHLLRFTIPLPVNSGAGYNMNPGQQGIKDSTSLQISTFLRETRRFLNRSRVSGGTAKVLCLVLLACYLPFSGYSVVAGLFKGRSVGNAKPPSFSKPIGEVIAENALPESIDDWRLVGVRNVNRSPDDPLGTNSIIWTYEGEGLHVEFSVDGYYSSWHDLSYCYAGLGWKQESANNSLDENASAKTTQLLLYRNAGDYATSYFSCFDSSCKAVEPAEASGTVVRNLINRLKSGSLMAEPKQEITPPVFQVQLMTSRATPFMAHEYESMKQLFTKLRDHVVVQIGGR